ncbi:MAG: 5-methylcytosine-specific restriction endonuclease system specificity protein McrC [Clostridiales bacterium]|jgi:5-methylcytosine-specific restriction enzyme subunit McrC|nr:5-methylcytosine-specific restriction endonuclease system specificity protein McrC [Clostridiales bacterium]
MTSDKGILIKNIYYMLTYAFQSLRQSNFGKVAAEEFENIHDMFAAILGKGVASQLKQGLYREYILQEEELSVLRGKLNIQGTIRNKIQHKQKLSCEYDELSENNLLNQILKTTMQVLVRQKTVKQEHKVVLKKNLVFFDNVDVIEPGQIKWDRIRYQKNNQSYRMLMNVCYLVITGLILSTDKGEVKLATFLDDRAMHSLYEKFILEYYRYHHPEYKANPDTIPWDIDDGMIEFLPAMVTDITLKYGGRTLIIDAKYYAHTMQSQYDVQSIHSGNLYQVFTYVKNLDKNNTGNVAGMLLYAKTQEQITPNNKYSMGGNTIWVKTLDLNLPFSQIAEQLEKIAGDYFG